jgi:hypothetical protein
MYTLLSMFKFALKRWHLSLLFMHTVVILFLFFIVSKDTVTIKSRNGAVIAVLSCYNIGTHNYDRVLRDSRGYSLEYIRYHNFGLTVEKRTVYRLGTQD